MTTAPSDIARLHMQAVATRLTTYLSAEAYTVYQGEVTDNEDAITYPYLVVWAAPVHRPVITMGGYDGTAASIVQVTAAGTSPNEVLAAADRASEALHLWRPTIAGRDCDRLQMDPAAPPPYPLRDPKVTTIDGRPVYSTVITLGFASTPEPAGS